MMDGKDANGFLAPLAPFAAKRGTFYAVPIPGKDNCMPSAELAEMAASVGLEAFAMENVDAALKVISAQPGPPQQVLITGSLYLAGQVLRDINFEIT